MRDEPRHSSRRRAPIQLEPLEGRTLLSKVTATIPVSAVTAPTPTSAVRASTPTSTARASTAPAPAQLVVNPSNLYVNQQQASFTVTLSLTKGISTGLRGLPPAAPLDQPLTVDFSASLDQPGSATTETTSPIFAPFHESVTFLAGASTETVTVPIVSSAATAGPVTIYLSAMPMSPTALGIPTGNGNVELYSSPEATPPTLTSVQLVNRGQRASAVVLGFSKPMAPATVEDIHNYRILSRPETIHRTGFLFGLIGGWSTSNVIHSFPIAAATYDPSTLAVTLTLKRPAKTSSLYEITSAYPVAGHVLTDPEGQPLAQPSYDPALYHGQFAILVHPIPGFTPPIAGLLKFTSRMSLGDRIEDQISSLVPIH